MSSIERRTHETSTREVPTATGDELNPALAVPESRTTIEVERVSKWYGDVVAVSDVSFRVEPGVTGLLGPNGAGKSTILKMLSGLLRPSTGSIRVLGQDVRGQHEVFRRIGLVPEQETIYPYLTGREFIRLNATLQNVTDSDKAIDRVIDTVDLRRAADRAVGGYSKGMRQRIKIAAALVHEPDVLILDEPLTGTDPVQRLQLIRLISRLGEEGKTVLVSSHVLHEVERFADRILVIVDGKLAAAGDYRAIRDKIDEHARTVRIGSDAPRRLAAALLHTPSVLGVHLADDDVGVVVETEDIRTLYYVAPRVAREQSIRLYEITALDDSLASVFAYVTER